MATVGRVFRARYAAGDAATNFLALRALLRATVLPLACVAVVIAVLGAFNAEARSLAATLGLSDVRPGSYDVLLEAVTAATGVFLAIYFAAMSSVAAAVYATVPNDIRALLVRDRFGNVYVYVVSFTMAFAVALLVVHAAADTMYPLGLPLVGLLAILSIFAFIQLGQRAFRLADPTLLSDSLARDFESWKRRAMHGGWRWDEPAFQTHYRTQARRSVDTLAGLLVLAQSQSHLRSKSARQLTRKVIALLVRYLESRSRIPTESLWFDRRFEHPSWYLVGSTELQMATEMATTIPPREVPDHHWVEDSLLTPIVAAASADDLEEAYVALDALRPLAEHFGFMWLADEGMRWAKVLSDAGIGALLPRDPAAADRPALIVGVADQLASFPLHVELGLHRALVEVDMETLAARLESANWAAPDTPYEFHLPHSALRILEEISAGIRFENLARAPDATRTPGWYVRQVAVNSFEWAIHRQINTTVSMLAAWYPDVADRLTEREHLDAAAAVHARGLETVWKLSRHIQEWEELVAKIRAIPQGIELSRPEWDWDELHTTADRLKVEMVQRLARSIPLLALAAPRSKNMPDFLGQAVHRSGEACFESLVAGDHQLFVRTFPTYFAGTLVIFDRLRSDVADWLPETAISWMTEPIMDALTLSGYALIFGELHGDRTAWEECQTAWLRYFSDSQGAERLAAVASMHQFHRNHFALSPRSILRSRWQMALGRQFEALPREPRHDFFASGEVRHPSALIRRLAPSSDLMGAMQLTEPSDVFIVKFLDQLPGADALDFGVPDWVVRELASDEPGESEEA